ncbi:MAG: methyltransferase domain-containing protein [Nanoarchaeota archaeon]
MNELKLIIKLAFITGLKDVVVSEVSRYSNIRVIKKDTDSLYLDFVEDLAVVKHLRSVIRAYVVVQSSQYNPLYISNHKSVLASLVEVVIGGNEDTFKSFKITCAGSDSPEVRSIAHDIKERYGISEEEEADMKIYIVKLGEIWEVGVQITPRPLSSRAYRVRNMSGAMDPTIAYGVNSLCGLEDADSYLNIFSGSATLLIEAGQCYPNLKQLTGFDNNKDRISLAIQNIKKAGLIRKIQLKEADIFSKPDLGRFDVITADLPFGMAISKNEDLEKLYQCFIEYSQDALHDGGTLALYTSEHEMLKRIILGSRFKIVKTLELKFMTSVNAYLRPNIFVCRLK